MKSKKKASGSEIGESGNMWDFTPTTPIDNIPQKAIRRSNIGEAHKIAITENGIDTTPLSQLFGQKIPPEKKIDIENEPFGIFEPSAKELETFSEAEELPLKLPKLPPKKKPKRESEYYEGDSSKESQKVTPGDTKVSNSFLAKLSNLENDILNDTRNSIGVGVFYKTRVGSAGLDALDNFVLPSF
ncbi:MAG TPA: hypothetical protein EYO61_04620, partial [Campylobacterales bacterium]|nr:hypothetical protein [Campylobacterales bacterium]